MYQEAVNELTITEKSRPFSTHLISTPSYIILHTGMLFVVLLSTFLVPFTWKSKFTNITPYIAKIFYFFIYHRELLNTDSGVWRVHHLSQKQFPGKLKWSLYTAESNDKGLTSASHIYCWCYFIHPRMSLLSSSCNSKRKKFITILIIFKDRKGAFLEHVHRKGKQD